MSPLTLIFLGCLSGELWGGKRVWLKMSPFLLSLPPSLLSFLSLLSSVFLRTALVLSLTPFHLSPPIDSVCGLSSSFCCSLDFSLAQLFLQFLLCSLSPLLLSLWLVLSFTHLLCQSCLWRHRSVSVYVWVCVRTYQCLWLRIIPQKFHPEADVGFTPFSRGSLFFFFL